MFFENYIVKIKKQSVIFFAAKTERKKSCKKMSSNNCQQRIFHNFAAMRKIIALSIITALPTVLQADEKWVFKAFSPTEQVWLNINLYEESIEVPGMEMFGPMNGYVNGQGIYGTWMVTSVKKTTEKEALINLSNDLGSETQAVRLSLPNDSTCVFEQQEGHVIKKAVGRKLVKIPQKIELKIIRERASKNHNAPPNAL